jgi:predicted metal-dependent HD superfamily phosphohydrolase
MDSKALDSNTQLDSNRFTELWKKLSVQFDTRHCNAVFTSLAKFYGDASRHYHCGGHINQCLSKLDEISAVSGYFPTVEIAIWFHDAVYTAGAPDNEENSMIWFRRQTEGHFSAETITEVCGLIMATEHKTPPETDLERITVDVDLSSFSLPFARFIADGKDIRKEFVTLTNNEFILGQNKFLQRLLDRPSFYSTEYFLTHYENYAQENIQKLVEEYHKQLNS